MTKIDKCSCNKVFVLLTVKLKMIFVRLAITSTLCDRAFGEQAAVGLVYHRGHYGIANTKAKDECILIPCSSKTCGNKI